MRVIEQMKRHNPLTFGIVMALITLSALLAGGFFSELIALVGEIASGGERISYYTSVLLQEVFAIAILLFFAYAAGSLNVLTRKGCGVLHSLEVALFPLCFAVYVGWGIWMSTTPTGDLQPAWEIAVFFVAMFAIAFVEEFAYRGIVADAFLRYYGTSTAGIWKATALSGVIFGASHLLNLIGVAPLGVFVQVAVAIVIGMLFAAIYFRTGNVWIVVFAHAMLNTSSLLQGALYEMGDSSTINGVVSSFSLANLLPAIIYGIPVLYLLRKSRHFEIQHWFGEPPPPEELPFEIE